MGRGKKYQAEQIVNLLRQIVVAVATFRGEKSVVRAGHAINVPANAPHNSSAAPRCE